MINKESKKKIADHIVKLLNADGEYSQNKIYVSHIKVHGGRKMLNGDIFFHNMTAKVKTKDYKFTDNGLESYTKINDVVYDGMTVKILD